MCIACEMNFWAMIDALPDEARRRILREQADQFACEVAAAPDGEMPSKDERGCD
jgi:hypothetical protein